MATTRPPNRNQLLKRLAPSLSPASLKPKLADPGSHQRLKVHVNHRKRQRKSHRRRPLRTEDDRELAADRNFALPSDNRPRLERQEAFRVSSTCRNSDAPGDDRDLYRLGLLYDDEHLRGSGFNLNYIVHPEPVYAVRPAKRTRKHREAQSEAENPSLELDFRSGSLFDDIVLARLLAPETDELPPVSSAPPPYDRGGDVFATRQNAPLDVIYESQECSLPSPPATPLAASLPDLVLDEDEEGFTLLDDELSESGDEYGMEDASSATGDPWIMLGDGS